MLAVFGCFYILICQSNYELLQDQLRPGEEQSGIALMTLYLKQQQKTLIVTPSILSEFCEILIGCAKFRSLKKLDPMAPRRRFLSVSGFLLKWHTQPAFTCSKFNNKITRTSCEIYSKLTIKTPERRQWCRFGVFIVIFEHISHLVPVFLLLTLSR